MNDAETDKLLELKKQIRQSDKLEDRLGECRFMFLDICSENRAPKYSEEPSPEDETLYIATTLADAYEQLKATNTLLSDLAFYFCKMDQEIIQKTGAAGLMNTVGEMIKKNKNLNIPVVEVLLREVNAKAYK
jgi:hypothetical protein